MLCLLRRNRDRFLTHDEMLAALRGSDLVVSRSVESLTAAGLVITEADGSARYSPSSPQIDVLVDAVEALYAKSPDAVRRLIVAAAAPGLTAFADAFRLRKE